jgi:NADH dehydrogenase (ubiquinone) 1 alpha subcomplex subunit 5
MLTGTPTARGQKKTSTGLVGLAVQPEARAVLIELHKKLAAELTKMPETFHYRTDAEESIQLRLATLLEETDVIRLEEELDDGQLESLIEEIHEDLNVNLPALFELKPWSAEVSKWDKAKLSLYSDVKLL